MTLDDLWTRLTAVWHQLDPLVASSSVKTLLLIVVIGLIRIALSRTVDRHPELGTPEMRRRWKVSVRNVALLVLVSGIVLIWAEELQSLMLSVVALGAAFVLAFKEVINCLSGTLVRTTTGAFAIGDRIELAGLRGDVVDHTLLSTTLMEVGPGQSTHQYTGRSIVVPNSMFLSNPVLNETFTDDFLLHAFPVTIARADDWRKAEQALLDASWAECRPYLEEARKFLERQARRKNLEPIDVEPRVNLRLDEPQSIRLVVRVVVPTRRKGRVEQAIIRRYLDAVRGDATAKPAVSAG